LLRLSSVVPFFGKLQNRAPSLQYHNLLLSIWEAWRKPIHYNWWLQLNTFLFVSRERTYSKSHGQRFSSSGWTYWHY
jgi:hypothetical protein